MPAIFGTRKRRWFTAFIVGWLLVTLCSYYWFNSAYYVEKLTVFGRFLVGIGL